MKADKTAPDTDPSGIPGEFRENYRFLSEHIACREKNSATTVYLENMPVQKLSDLRGKLNKRQTKIVCDYLKISLHDEPVIPPVPPELEASIRIRRRTAWLPWESEAIRKIDTWRKDITAITCQNQSLSTGAAIPLRADSLG